MSAPREAIACSQTADIRSWPRLRAAIVSFDPTPGTWLIGVLILVSLSTMFVMAFLLTDDTAVALVLTLLVGLLALLGFVLGMVTSTGVRAPRAIDVGMALVGVSISQFMTREMGMPLLVAGAAAGTFVGLACLPGMPLDAMSSGSAYTAVFTGLVPQSITLPSWTILLAGVVAGTLFSIIGPSVMPGVGARMGTAAFMGGSLVYFMADALGAERPPLLPPPHEHLPHWAVVPLGFFAAIITWVLVDRFRMPFVLASAGPALVICALIASYQPIHAPTLGAAWLGGTFVGGSGSNRLPTALWVGVAGAIFGSLMLHFDGPLKGHMGVIGATGTIAVLATVGLEWWLHVRPLAHAVSRVVALGEREG